uniref:Uncharacterized protein n=2 Tax=Bursaphelenchus xylophilus TaxID=6326 RepID=A0A1I7SHM7_BURXY
MAAFPYVPFMTLFPVSFAAATSLITYYCAYTQPVVVRCSINGPLDKFLLRVLHWTHCFICCLTLFIYLKAWHSTTALSATKRKIMKALILIVSGFTASWLLTSVGSTVIYLNDLRDPYLFVAQFSLTGVLLLCGVWDYCIYYRLNAEYHRAFIEQLGVHWYKKLNAPSANTEATGTESNGSTTPIKQLSPTDTIRQLIIKQ